MKHITKLALSIFLVFAMVLCQSGMVFGAVDLLGSSTKYMYNGVIVTSATYNCADATTGTCYLWWTVYDASKSARDWPRTVHIEGNTVYDTDKTGTKLCTLTVGNAYDIRAVFVHSATQTPYYYLMIEGEGVTANALNGSYVDGVWISDVRNSHSGKITSGDGIATLQNGFELDHLIVTDGLDNPDMYYNNHHDFRNVVYADGALHIDVLWTPNPESVTAENISVLNGDSEITVDKFVCDGNRISIYSKELSRGQTYTVSLKDTMLTSRGNPIRIPLKIQYTIPNNDADILAVVLSDGTLTLNAQNLTSEDFNFTVLIALKSDDGKVNEVIVCDPCTVTANTVSEEIVIDNLDFKSFTPEAYIVKSALLPVPVSDRSYK